jgi:hypothetical protein
VDVRRGAGRAARPGARKCRRGATEAIDASSPLPRAPSGVGRRPRSHAVLASSAPARVTATTAAHRW